MQLHSQRRADCCYNCSHVVLVALTALACIIASRSPSDTAVSALWYSAAMLSVLSTWKRSYQLNSFQLTSKPQSYTYLSLGSLFLSAQHAYWRHVACILLYFASLNKKWFVHRACNKLLQICYKLLKNMNPPDIRGPNFRGGPDPLNPLWMRLCKTVCHKCDVAVLHGISFIQRDCVL